MKTELINFDDGEICGFCFDTIKDANTCCAPPCNHLFCKECIALTLLDTCTRCTVPFEIAEPVCVRMCHVIPDDDDDVPDGPDFEDAERVRQSVESFFIDLERVMVKALIIVPGATVLRLLGVPSPVTSILMAMAFAMHQQNIS